MKNSAIEVEFGPAEGSYNPRNLANATLKASERHRRKIKCLPHPATGEREYSLEELDFMQRVESFKARTGRKFPTITDYFAIAREMLM